MAIQRIEPNARMSQVVVHGQTAYLSGQVGRPEDTIRDQMRTILTEIDRLLAHVGSHKSKVLQATIWLSEIADFGVMNEVWEAWIDPQNPPARATGEVKLAGPEYKIEITVVAAV